MTDTTTVSARVVITLDIPSGQSWGRDYSMSQIVDQAKEAVLGMLERDLNRNYQIIGKPKVTAVFAKESGL